MMQPRTSIARAGARILVVIALALGALSATALSGAATARPGYPPPSPSGFGPNVYLFSPSMSQATIQNTVDAIADQQIPNQFGRQRYALLFEPGTYGTPEHPLSFQVGYYTQVAGLGRSPQDVIINGTINVYNQCYPTNDPGTTDCTALNNFWRSLSNLTVNITGQTGCRSGTDFWATSQAASLRRVNMTGGNVSLMDYCGDGPYYASGGFIADSSFSGGTVINGSQQQFLVRNSNLDGWTNGVWNQVFSGTVGAPAENFAAADGTYTTLPTSPVTQEQPFLYLNEQRKFEVFLPAVQHDSLGTSWNDGPPAGTSVPINKFFIANPKTPVSLINKALAHGGNLILTPGVYDLKHSIEVTRPHAVVLGLGFPTLVPRHGDEAMHVADVPGVKLTGMIFDAGRQTSADLLRLGDCARCHRRSSGAEPTVVQDVYFRVGGATPGRVKTAFVVNSANVILDNVWSWRADHGSGVGWNANTADTGVIVNGDDVTAYGLFVEHYQKYQAIWNGERGTDIFFQNEMPYDVPNQAAWKSSATTDGYAAFLVSPGVTTFHGYGMGSYSFFNQGVPIFATQAFQVPRRPGVQLHDLLTVFLTGSGGINSVVDGTGAAVYQGHNGPSKVLDFP